MSARDTQYSASESKRGLERRIECEKIAAVQEFIERVLGNLRAVGLPTDDCDGDEAPETILSGWIIANTLDASHRISDLEHRIDLLRATHETDKATLLRLAKAARNVVEMLPHGPDRYELEISLGGGGAEQVGESGVNGTAEKGSNE